MADQDHGECPMCSCGEHILLGELGNLTHLRCRGCGWNHSLNNENTDNNEGTEETP